MRARREAINLAVGAIMVVGSCGWASEAETSGDIVRLVKQTREKYRSYEISYTMKRYRCKDFEPERGGPQGVTEVLLRCAGDGRMYAEVERRSYEYGENGEVLAERSETREYAITPTRSKRLNLEGGENRGARGIIDSGRGLQRELPSTLDELLWELFGRQWEIFTAPEAEMARDAKDGTYRLKAVALDDGTTLSVTIDPDHGYLRRAYEFRKPGGDLLIKVESGGYKEGENGLWWPREYRFATAEGLNVYEVHRCRINTRFRDEELDFRFPRGTIVYDRTTNSRYMVESTREAVDDSSPEVSANDSGARPADETQRPADVPDEGAAVRERSQFPSPMTDSIRAHERIEKKDAPGVSFVLEGVLAKAVEVYFSNRSPEANAADLVVHFHGVSYVPKYAVYASGYPVVLAVVNLGSGSGVYENAFQDGSTFPRLIGAIRDAVAERTSRDMEISRVYLSSFSAGYGAVRAILRDHLAMLDGIVLLDGLHTDYVPPRQVLAEGGKLNGEKLEGFLRHAQLATGGEKRMLITHSAIFPGTYASTTECTDYLIDALHLKRQPVLRWGPVGMQLLSETREGGLTILGFAGNSAPDHVDHFHGLPVFLEMILGEG